MWLFPGLEQEMYNMSLGHLVTLERKEAMRKTTGEYIYIYIAKPDFFKRKEQTTGITSRWKNLNIKKKK